MTTGGTILAHCNMIVPNDESRARTTRAFIFWKSLLVVGSNNICNLTTCELENNHEKPKNWLDACIPLLITSTQVQSTIVGIRCATVITVLSLNSVLIIFWRIASVAVSMDAVASSRIKMQFLLNSARAKQSNCLWPMLQFDPPSTTVGQSK